MSGSNLSSISMKSNRTGASTKSNEMGMRTMQERAYDMRGEQYLLIKSPPASGKSRALMFITLDKLTNQGVKKAIIAVPERSIGGSFGNEELSKYGFWADWNVESKWNLCSSMNSDNTSSSRSKVSAVGDFISSEDRVLVCTHATLRFAVERLGISAFDNFLIAIDEFHHVSADVDANVLGAQLKEFIARDKIHLVAMTGSYFRGDAIPVLSPEDEEKFKTVTYTYYEQLNGYEHLKSLDLGYYFYSGSYLDAIEKVLDPDKKTIIHIPNVNSRESTGLGKHQEAERIMDILGKLEDTDPITGFHLIKRLDGKILKVADLVEDDPTKRDKVISSLKDAVQRNNKDHVDIIIALGMAKEGFDWIWCEHALTVGYRASLTEIIQIIGRATRDAPGKLVAKFTNFVAEPDASEEAVREAVNDTLKAIAASLLMEQVLAPRFNFTPKNNGPLEGYDYGPEGYSEDTQAIGFNKDTGQIHIEIKGLTLPETPEATRICQQDINEVIAAFVQDKKTAERGLFDTDILAEEMTQVRMGAIVRERYPDFSSTDQEAIRQHAIAALNVTQKAKVILSSNMQDDEQRANTAFIDGVRQFALSVKELDIDLIDRINPFEQAYAILSKSMSEQSLREIADIINSKKLNLSFEEAEELFKRAYKFAKERGRPPNKNSQDAWERRLAEGMLAYKRMKEARTNG